MPRVVSASREIAAAAEKIFGLIADPARQPQWDGNDNLAVADAGQRVRRAGDVFTMKLTSGARFPAARATTAERLQASLERLAALAALAGPS